jgi:hypothetical protein
MLSVQRRVPVLDQVDFFGATYRLSALCGVRHHVGSAQAKSVIPPLVIWDAFFKIFSLPEVERDEISVWKLLYERIVSANGIYSGSGDVVEKLVPVFVSGFAGPIDSTHVSSLYSGMVRIPVIENRAIDAGEQSDSNRIAIREACSAAQCLGISGTEMRKPSGLDHLTAFSRISQSNR